MIHNAAIPARKSELTIWNSSSTVWNSWGSRDGAVVRALAFHQCGPGSIPGLDVICGLSLLLVLFSAPRGFSPGTPVFPSPQKPTFLNSNSIRNARLAREIGQPLLTLSSLNKTNLINLNSTEKYKYKVVYL